MQRVQRFDNPRGAELALHVPVVGDSVAAFMARPDADAAAIRAADSPAFLPSDPSAADVAGALAPVVAELAGQ